MALLIDAADELLGFLLRTWIDMAQQPIQSEGITPDQVGRVFDGLWWHTIHLDPILTRRADSEGGGLRECAGLVSGLGTGSQPSRANGFWPARTAIRSGARGITQSWPC